MWTLINWVLGLLAAWLVWWQIRPTLGLRRIDAKAFAAALERGDDWQVIDVRTAAEYDAGHIAESLNIPLAQLRARVGEIRRDAPVVLICRSGHRAAEAYHILRRRRFANCLVLRGGVLAWQAFRLHRNQGGMMPGTPV